MANVPTGVKILAVLDYIGAVLLLLLGIGMIFGAGSIGEIFKSIPLIGTWLSGFIIVLAIILIAFAVLSFFMGRGLWKGQNWARILTIIFAILGVISAVMGMVNGNITGNIVSLIIEGVIGGYLLFSKSVKSAFSA